MALLADDLTAELLAQLRKSSVAETDLRRRVGASRQSISRRLADLESWSIVAGARQPTPGRGAPTTMWRLAGPWIFTFEEVADRLVLQLLEEVAAEQRAAVESTERWRPRIVEDKGGH